MSRPHSLTEGNILTSLMGFALPVLAALFLQTMYGAVYVKICSAGSLFIAAYNLLGSIFRGLGNSRLPLLSVSISFLVISAIVNTLGVIPSAGVDVAEKLCGFVLAGVFSGDREVAVAAADYLRAYAIDCLLVSFMFCMTGFFNGCGRTAFVMFQGIAGAYQSPSSDHIIRMNLTIRGI